MKLRTSFITNSSSSSFILAFKDDQDSYNFFHKCDLYDYDKFYELIDILASDWLMFSNDTLEEMPIRPLIEKIKHINWGSQANLKLKKLYEEDHKIEPHTTTDVRINSLKKGIEVNLDELDFEEICEEDKYSIEILSNKDNRDKNAALEFLRNVYSWDFKRDILDEKFPNARPLNEDWKQKSEYEKSEEMNLLIEDYLINNQEYQEKKKQIEDAEIVVKGMIWDTSGGLLEWAIRNGFIEDNFRKNCVICYNVG